MELINFVSNSVWLENLQAYDMNCFYSFDVFDTVLTRTVTDPKDVFILMRQRLMDSSYGPNNPLVESFWGTRILAEFLARRRTKREDVDIYEIYDVVRCLFKLDDCQVEKLIDVELEVEKAVLVPVYGANELLTSLRASGRGVVFVSDMYLPKFFIQEILEKYGLFLPGDRLYVSGDVGRTKGSGSLFTYVFEDLGISPSELVHYGDHPYSDGTVPNRLGISLLREKTWSFKYSLAIRSLVIKIYYAFQLMKAVWQSRGIVRV